MNTPNELEKLSEPFKALIGNAWLNYQLLEMHPIPIEIFAPDGTVIFANRALLELNGIPDANLLVGKYNLKNDPVCLKILGQDVMDKIFNGEAVSIPDFPVSIQAVVDRGITDGKPFEAATMDMFLLPLWDGDVFTCTICFATVKNMYKGRADIVKAQKYMDEHWGDEFDLDKTAQAVNLSSRHFRRIFKEVTNSTPIEYYQNLKIKKIQEKLLDESISVEQAFADCGVDFHGAYFRLFKEKVKMSPSEYRKNNTPQ